MKKAVLFIFAIVILSGCSSEPLEEKTNNIALSNGATVRVEAVEQRHWKSDGWTVRAYYIPPNSEQVERIGALWEGDDFTPVVHVLSELVVFLNPAEDVFYVRTKDGKWKHFFMELPSRDDSLPMKSYINRTTLTESEILKICNELDPHERGWPTGVILESFEPDTMEIHLTCRTNRDTKWNIFLRLSDDGSDLSLSSIKKEERPTRSSTLTD